MVAELLAVVGLLDVVFFAGFTWEWEREREREREERLKREIGEEREMSFLLLIYYVVYIILLDYMYKKELKYWVYY